MRKARVRRIQVPAMPFSPGLLADVDQITVPSGMLESANCAVITPFETVTVDPSGLTIPAVLEVASGRSVAVCECTFAAKPALISAHNSASPVDPITDMRSPPYVQIASTSAAVISAGMSVNSA